MRATHSCSHDKFVCSICVPTLPGCCGLYLLDVNLRLNPYMPKGSLWNWLKATALVNLNPILPMLLFKNIKGIVHIVEPTLETLLDPSYQSCQFLFSRPCTKCHISFRLGVKGGIISHDNCPSCGARLAVVSGAHNVLRVGLELTSSVDLQSLVGRSTILKGTEIADPNYIPTTQSRVFELSELLTRQELSQESLNRGVTEDHSNKFDYNYSISFKVHTRYPQEWAPNPTKEELIIDDLTLKYDKLKAVRHDFVGNRLKSTTDMKFSDIGIMSRLTPDYISTNRKAVLELATNASGNLKSMETSYISKRLNYEAICNQAGYELFIIVVSPDMVLSNMNLSSQEVDFLCTRCKIGLSLEGLLEDRFGLSFSIDSDDIKVNQEIHEAFSDFNEQITLPENFHFNHQLLELNRALTQNEDEHAMSILKRTLTESIIRTGSKRSKVDLQEYLDRFNSENSQQHPSSITIFPMIIMKPANIQSRGNFPSVGTNKNLPAHLWAIVKSIDLKHYLIHETLSLMQSRQNTKYLIEEYETELRSKMYNYTPSRKMPKHKWREEFKFQPVLDEENLLDLALKGVGAKSLQDNPAIISKEARKKKSFHPNTAVHDIELFWTGTDLAIEDESWIQLIEQNQLMKFLDQEKTNDPLKLVDEVESVSMLRSIMHLKSSQLGELITDICTEISMEYKIPTRPGEWLVKPLRQHKAVLFLYPTGSHTFFFLAMTKEESMIIDTGKLGPSIFETSNYYVSNISSITEAYIEHFIKASTYIPMFMAHLLYTYKFKFDELNDAYPEEICQSFNYMVLTYINNKVDHEEMLTNLRFLYMNLLQEMDSNPYDYIPRLNDVFRSRMSVFTLNRIISIIRYYEHNRIMKRKTRTSKGFEWHHRNLRSVYHNGYLDLDQLIDSFYYSYVVTKNKSAMGDHTFKIFQKIFKEQVKGYETIEREKIPVWGLLDEPMHHRWDYALNRKMLELTYFSMREMHGQNVLELVKRSIYKNISKIRFSDIATLKASSKDYSDGVNLPDPDSGMTRTEYLEKVKKLNKGLIGKRPRVLSKLVNLIDEYKKESGVITPTPIKVILWTAEKLLIRGYVYSDSFIKDQHNGIRESHVLEIMARVIQFLSELISKSINRYMDNDSIAVPENKKRFYYSHEREAEAGIGRHLTVGKSADASKWCQRNHVSQFFVDLMFFTPSELHPFLYSMYYLWTKKRIALPPELFENLDINRDVFSTNSDYIYMRDAFHQGLNPFLEKRCAIVETPFGMWQGICHSASCLKHNIVQMGWKALTQAFLTSVVKIPHKTTIIQGSDDSSALISIPHHNPGLIMIIIGLLWWKEKLSEYLSIWTSLEKTSVGTVNLVEYNSDWYCNGRNIKPLFRWNSACLETSLVERLPERTEQFYNSLSQSLETGSGILLCAVIQLLQAKLHYQIMGVGSHLFSMETIQELSRSKNVSLGYFPLEIDHICGITGLDYKLYLLSRQGISLNNWEIEFHDTKATLEYDSKIDKVIKGSLRNYTTKFSNIQSYLEVLKKTGLPKVAELMDKVEKTPELLYVNLHTWEQEELKMALQLEQPSVRSSLSNHQPTARMMASGAYLISTPCVTCMDRDGHKIKRSLLAWLRRANSPKNLINNSEGGATAWFVNQDQYKNFEELIVGLKNNISYQAVQMRRTTKVELLVWGSKMNVDVPLIDVARRQWFNVRSIQCSKEAFQLIWQSYKKKYPFLEDRYDETLKKLGFDSISFYRMMESISEKTRYVRLSDTVGRRTDVWNTATRLYWPNVKVRANYHTPNTSIRELKHGLHCLLTYFYKKEIILKHCVDIICANNLLSQDSAIDHEATFRLKIIYDFINGASNLELMDRIERGKLGVLGFFSIRQEQTGSGYKGAGEWLGLVHGVPTRIKMMGKTVTEVRIKRLTDIQAQASSIKQLIRDFNLSYHEEGIGSLSKLYIMAHGLIERNTEAPPNSVPLIVSSHMEVDVKSKILSQKWFLDCEGDKLRLSFSESGKEYRTQKFTILSESFSSAYWDPLLPSPSLDDINFQNWCKGYPVKPLTLMDQVLFPSEIQDVKPLPMLLRSYKYSRPDTNYSLRKIISSLKLFILKKSRGSTFTQLKYELSEDVTTGLGSFDKPIIDEKKIMEIKEDALDFLRGLGNQADLPELAGMNMSDNDLANIGESFGQLSEPEPSDRGDKTWASMYEEDIYGSEDDQMEELKDLFFNRDHVIEDSIKQWITGYRSNQQQLESFLAPFLDIFEDMPNETEVLGALQRNNNLIGLDLFGVGGALLYTCFESGEYQGSRLSVKQQMAEDTPIGDFLSQSSAQGLSTLQIDKLKEELEQVRSLIPNLTEPVLSTLLSRQRRLESEISYVENQMQLAGTSHGLSSYHKNKVLTAVYKELISNDFWEMPIHHPQERVMVEALISYAIDSLDGFANIGLISQNEAESIRSQAWGLVMSDGILKAISLYLQTSILLTDGNEEIFDYSKSFF
nr:MAG: RNA-dependent RNA polymerase [Yunnan phenui-like virus]